MKVTKLLIATAFVAVNIANAASAADVNYDPGHPRVNEVDNRIETQEQRDARQEANGKITQRQENRDDQRLREQQNRAAADEAKNGGHLTAKEDKSLNVGLNRDRRRDEHQVNVDKAAQ